MHTDEAVNGYITGQLVAGEDYKYDPQDRHGPALYLATIPIARLAGAESLADLNEKTVRLVPTIFSFLLVLLLAAAAPQVGFVSAIIAALFFILAPLPVYYGRYFIHEMLFLAGSLALWLAGWRTLELKSLRAAAAVGSCAGFVLACKETAVLLFAALALPALWWAFVRRSELTRRKAHWTLLVRPALIAFAAFVFVTVLFYTWGGKHWEGPLDLLRSYPRFASRAGGEGHEKPFGYYFTLLGSGAGAALFGLAFVGCIHAFRNRPGSEPARRLLLQMLVVYALSIWGIHSLIPYKNPWLALNLWLPLALLAGVGFQTLWQASARLPARALLIAGLLLVNFGLARETWRWCFLKPADERNPYAYAHTVEDLLGLPERIEKVAARLPAKRDLKIAVCAADPWPLPWYLRQFPNTGYFQPGQNPGGADIYITSLECAELLQGTLDGWRPEFFGVRPEVLVLLWKPPEHE